MRIHEVLTTAPKTPEQARVQGLKRSVTNAQRALATEKERQRRQREQQRQQQAQQRIAALASPNLAKPARIA